MDGVMIKIRHWVFLVISCIQTIRVNVPTLFFSFLCYMMGLLSIMICRLWIGPR